MSGDETQWAFLKSTGSKLRFWNDKYRLYLWYDDKHKESRRLVFLHQVLMQMLSSGAQE